MEHPVFQAHNLNFAEDVRRFVLSMPVAQFYGFDFGEIRPGYVETIQPYRKELSHQDGFFQGGVIGAIADFAGASAALTLLPAGWVVATIDFTVKIVAPAAGERLIARGRVLKPNQTVTVSSVDVFAVRGDRETLCASAFVTTRNINASPDRASNRS